MVLMCMSVCMCILITLAFQAGTAENVLKTIFFNPKPLELLTKFQSIHSHKSGTKLPYKSALYLVCPRFFFKSITFGYAQLW